MTGITFDTYPFYKRLINAGMTKQQAKAQIEIMIEISQEMNLDKPIKYQHSDKPNKPFWKEALKTFLWTYLISMAVTLVIVLEIVGLKHITFT